MTKISSEADEQTLFKLIAWNCHMNEPEFVTAAFKQVKEDKTITAILDYVDKFGLLECKNAPFYVKAINSYKNQNTSVEWIKNLKSNVYAVHFKTEHYVDMISHLDVKYAVKFFNDQLAVKNNKQILLASLIVFEQKGIDSQVVSQDTLYDLCTSNDALAFKALNLLNQTKIEQIIFSDRPADIRQKAFLLMKDKTSIVKAFFTCSDPVQKKELHSFVESSEEYKKHLELIRSMKTVALKLDLPRFNSEIMQQNLTMQTERKLKTMLLRLGYNLVHDERNRDVLQILINTYSCGEFKSLGSGICLKASLGLFDIHNDKVFKIYSDSGPLPDELHYKASVFFSGFDQQAESKFRQAVYKISEDNLLRQIKKELEKLIHSGDS